MAGNSQFAVLDMPTSDGRRAGLRFRTSTAAGKEKQPALQSDYPLQNVRMAFCSVPTLANPSAAAAPLSPPYCRTIAEVLWPTQLGVPGVPGNTNSE